MTMVLRLLTVFLLIHNVKSELIPLSCKEKRQIIDAHNSRRMDLALGNVPYQPAAAEMNMILWDEELEYKAATWASYKINGHNPDPSIPSKRFITGENIYYVASTDPDAPIDMENMFKAWWDEHWNYYYKNLTYSDIYGPPEAGHYTQMAWSDSIYLGCGMSKYYRDYYYIIFLVCNYGPAGNWIGLTPYKAGPPSNRLVCGTRNCSHPYGLYC